MTYLPILLIIQLKSSSAHRDNLDNAHIMLYAVEMQC